MIIVNDDKIAFKKNIRYSTDAHFYRKKRLFLALLKFKKSRMEKIEIKQEEKEKFVLSFREFDKNFMNLNQSIDKHILLRTEFQKQWLPSMKKWGYPWFSKDQEVYTTAASVYNRFRFELDNPGKLYKVMCVCAK